MDAKVTMTMTPAEFDLTRQALREMAADAKNHAEGDNDPKDRAAARTLQARIAELLAKL